jgi:hypothetical protein
MATTTKQGKDMTKAERKALAAKVAKDKEAGLSGQALRDKYGSWLTGPERRKLFREFGHDGLIAASYDRVEAKAKREALQAKLAEQSRARAKTASKPAAKRTARTAAAKPAQAPSQPATAEPQAS